jgi:hypothetical protein
MKRAVLFAFTVAGIALASPEGMAQRGPSTFPVIVVLRADAQLSGAAGEYVADERARANPAAWGYVDRRVAGAVQASKRAGASRPNTCSAMPSADSPRA